MNKHLYHNKEFRETLRPRLPEYAEKIGIKLVRTDEPRAIYRLIDYRLVGYCPLHDDTAPNFEIMGKGLQWCICSTCGFAGSAIALCQALGRAASYEDALVDIATTLGIPVPDAPQE